eukprot:scaffold200291_cov22-Tisochrysis_lutea.AAC.2
MGLTITIGSTLGKAAAGGTNCGAQMQGYGALTRWCLPLVERWIRRTTGTLDALPPSSVGRRSR